MEAHQIQGGAADNQQVLDSARGDHMTTKTSRRAILDDIAADTVDPVMSLIEKYWELYAAFSKMSATVVVSKFDDVSDAAHDLEPSLDGRLARNAIERDAVLDLLGSTRATSAAGAAGLIRVAIRDIEDNSGGPSWSSLALANAATALEAMPVAPKVLMWRRKTRRLELKRNAVRVVRGNGNTITA
jgi:hypothetical protein